MTATVLRQSVHEQARHMPADAGDDSLAVMAKTLIIGLGNPLLTDDRVGLHVIARLKSILADQADVEVAEDYWGGLRLMERMIGYDRVIVVDAICTGAPVGTVRQLAVDSIPTQKSGSAHDTSLPTALALGRLAGAQLPSNTDIQLVAIEVEDLFTFSEECTPAVNAAVPVAIREVLRLLHSPSGGPAE